MILLRLRGAGYRTAVDEPVFRAGRGGAVYGAYLDDLYLGYVGGVQSC